MKIEIPHITSMEKSILPAEYRFKPLEQVPPAYKKPRINYLVDDYYQTPFDTQIQKFFIGFENCSTIEKISNSIVDWLMI